MALGSILLSDRRYNPWLALPAGLALVLWFQFAREVSHALNRIFYHILSVKAIGTPVYWLQGVTGYQLYTPIFWSKMLYSTLILALIGLTLWLYARNRRERKFALGLPVLGLAAAIVLNILGKLVGSSWVETFSRDSFEFILSPLPVVFVIPAMTLLRQQGQRNTKKVRE